MKYLLAMLLAVAPKPSIVKPRIVVYENTQHDLVVTVDCPAAYAAHLPPKLDPGFDWPDSTKAVLDMVMHDTTCRIPTSNEWRILNKPYQHQIMFHFGR